MALEQEPDQRWDQGHSVPLSRFQPHLSWPRWIYDENNERY